MPGDRKGADEEGCTGRDAELMERLKQLFDQKYREYQDYLDEKSWADAALTQSYLMGVLHCMWALWDRNAENAKQCYEEIAHLSHRIEE